MRPDWAKMAESLVILKCSGAIKQFRVESVGQYLYIGLELLNYLCYDLRMLASPVY